MARGGNVISTEDVPTLLIDGIDESIRFLVARLQGAHLHTKLLELVQFPQAEGDADRSRSTNARRFTNHSPYKVVPVNHVQSPSE